MAPPLNSLDFKHISSYTKEALDSIQRRRDGEETSLKTGFNKIDKYLLGGIPWNSIKTIGAMSGSGKSILCEQLKRNFYDHNPNEKFEILSFEFEMPIVSQIIRNLSGLTNNSVRDILSIDKKITDSQLEYLKSKSKSIDKYPCWSVEAVGTVDQIINTIESFIVQRNLIERNYNLIITIDHVLLTLGKENEQERTILAKLYRSFISLKKDLISRGISVIFLLLCQLNRNIEKPERTQNPDLHYPNRTDLFGSNDIFMGSDYVIVIHKPVLILKKSYGHDNLPLVDIKGTPFIYFHILKNRTGELMILQMKDDFKNSKILE